MFRRKGGRTTLDRLFRDAADALVQTRAWDRAGVALHVVDMGGTSLNTASAVGRMFLTMTAAFAELERSLVSERTSAAMQQRSVSDSCTGWCPMASSSRATGLSTSQPNWLWFGRYVGGENADGRTGRSPRR